MREETFNAGLLHAASLVRAKADSLRLGAEDGVAPAYAEDIELCERLAVTICAAQRPQSSPDDSWKHGAAYAAQKILDHIEMIDTPKIATSGCPVDATMISAARVCADGFIPATIQKSTPEEDARIAVKPTARQLAEKVLLYLGNSTEHALMTFAEDGSTFQELIDLARKVKSQHEQPELPR